MCYYALQIMWISMTTDFTYCKRNTLYRIIICLDILLEKLDCISYASINQIEMSQDAQKVKWEPKYYLILTHLSLLYSQQE